MLKTKTSAILSLVLVFVSGALVGVLAHRAYVVSATSSNPSVPPRKLSPADWRRHVLAEMRDKLKLDDAQVKQINDIYDQVDAEFHQLRAKQGQAMLASLVEKINAVLRPDQQELYKQYREERERERERRRMQGPPPGGPGGPPPGGPGEPPPGPPPGRK